MTTPEEPVSKGEKRRYRVVLWFDGEQREVEAYAEALSRVWDDFHGITSQGTQLARLREDYEILAEPIKRSS